MGTKKKLSGIEAIISKLSKVASDDATRYNLTQILIEQGHAVATNGHVLARIVADGIPPGSLMRAGKSWVSAGSDAPKFPDYMQVRPSETFAAYEIPLCALLPDASGLILDPEREAGILTWNEHKKQSVVREFQATFPVKVLDDRAAKVGCSLPYLRTIALALDHDPESGGSLVVYQCATGAQEARDERASGKPKGMDGAWLDYLAPLEIRSPFEPHNGPRPEAFGLVMPVRL